MGVLIGGKMMELTEKDILENKIYSLIRLIKLSKDLNERHNYLRQLKETQIHLADLKYKGELK